VIDDDDDDGGDNNGRDRSYIERIERHLEVKFNKLHLFTDVITLCAQEQHVWNAKQRYKNKRRFRQTPAQQ